MSKKVKLKKVMKCLKDWEDYYQREYNGASDCNWHHTAIQSETVLTFIREYLIPDMQDKLTEEDE